MGAEITGAENITTAGTDGPGRNSGTAATSAKGTGTGTRTNTGTSAGTNAEEIKSKSLSGISDLEKEQALEEKKKNGTITDAEKAELTRLKKNRKKRERYNREKEERDKAGLTQGEPLHIVTTAAEDDPLKNVPKPKNKARAKAKPQKNSFDADQLDALLIAVFDVIATRPGMAAWKITKQEAHSITVPLCEVLAKYDQLNALTRNSAEIALVVACVTVFVPRIIATVKVKKEVAQDGLNGKSNTGSTGRKLDEKRPSKTHSGTDVKQASTPRQNDGFVGDIFGSPL